MTFRLAVVVPTYGHLGFARAALHSLATHTKDFKAILVDDASPEWATESWSSWPLEHLHRHRFPKQGGLTRSWNYGLAWARDSGAEFTVVTNSDVLFTPGWFDSLAWALGHGADLAGPLTNAPGHKPKQQIKSFFADYKVTDDREYLARIAARCHTKLGNKAFIKASINGFCMAARTATWWANAFNPTSVFNPKFKTVGNEDELQKRWAKRGKVLAIVPGSFVFHYRGVSRKGGLLGREGQGWFRPAKT
jgi:glycosyltransferase involved in cell wall biosynthesis